MPITGCTYIPDIPITFPLPHYPTAASWNTYPLSQYWKREDPSGFLHPRPSTGRMHAAVDLYAPRGTSVMAIADGVVVGTARQFQYPAWKDETPGNARGYVITVAIAIQHPGLGIVRYCELDPHVALGIFWHAPVRRGQIVGTVGFQGATYQGAGENRKLVAAQSMLHLEWYSDWQDSKVDLDHDAKNAHPLSNQTNSRYDNFPDGVAFQRRHDLIDPTELIRRAELSTQTTLPTHHLSEPRPQFTNFGPGFVAMLRSAPVQPGAQCDGSKP